MSASLLTGSPADPADPAHPAGPGGRRRRVAAIVLGLTTAIGVMVLAFAAPALNAGAEDLPLAVSGTGPAVEQFAAALEAQDAGTFEVTVFDSADQAGRAIREQEAIGGVVLSDSGVTILTAAGAGAPYVSLLKATGSYLAASDQDVTYSELVPTTADDPTGIGISVLGLPLIFGGMASAAALLLGYRGPLTSRLVAALTVAVLGGFVAAAMLQFGFGAFDGSYWLTAAALSTGIAAISLPVLGLGLLVGYPGLATGAVIMLFVANPLSGLASGPSWLPQPWGEIGQFLPVGAAGSAIRSAAYFDGRGSLGAWLVLMTWALGGLALARIGATRAHTTES